MADRALVAALTGRKSDRLVRTVEEARWSVIALVFLRIWRDGGVH